RVRELASQCQVNATQLLAFADQTEFSKYSINIQLIILMVQVAYDLFLSSVTGGLSMAEALASIFFTRSVVRQILSMLVEAVVMAVLPDLITQGFEWANGRRAGIDLAELGQSAQMGLIGAGVGALGGKV